MPTEPWKKLLNRDFDLANAKDLIEIASPLLQEVVNYSTTVFQRCRFAGNSSGGDIAAFTLFYHAITLTDGIEVLLGQSSCESTIPLLRSMFEALLSMKYLFQKDYERRSLTWYYCDTVKREQYYSVLDVTSDKGKKFKARLSKEHPGIQIESAEPNDLHSGPNKLEGQEFEDIERAYKETKKRLSRVPEWYALFGGPQNLRELAKAVEKATYYDLLYRQWSMAIHAGDVSRAFQLGDQGKMVGHQIRYPSKLKNCAAFSVRFLLTAIDLMLERFRPDEHRHQEWVRKVTEENRRLLDFPVIEKRVPF